MDVLAPAEGLRPSTAHITQFVHGIRILLFARVGVYRRFVNAQWYRVCDAGALRAEPLANLLSCAVKKKALRFPHFSAKGATIRSEESRTAPRGRRSRESKGPTGGGGAAERGRGERRDRGRSDRSENDEGRKTAGRHKGGSENRRQTAKRDRKRQTPKGGRRLAPHSPLLKKSLCGGGVPSSHPSLGLSVFFLFRRGTAPRGRRSRESKGPTGGGGAAERGRGERGDRGRSDRREKNESGKTAGWYEGCSENWRGTAKRDRKSRRRPRVGDG